MAFYWIEMNSRPIPAEKGGPVRLLAPGVGDLCANVKNVRRIELTRGPGQNTRPSLRVCEATLSTAQMTIIQDPTIS